MTARMLLNDGWIDAYRQGVDIWFSIDNVYSSFSYSVFSTDEANILFVELMKICLDAEEGLDGY